MVKHRELENFVKKKLIRNKSFHKNIKDREFKIVDNEKFN